MIISCRARCPECGEVARFDFGRVARHVVRRQCRHCGRWWSITFEARHDAGGWSLAVAAFVRMFRRRG